MKIFKHGKVRERHPSRLCYMCFFALPLSLWCAFSWGKNRNMLFSPRFHRTLSSLPPAVPLFLCAIFSCCTSFSHQLVSICAVIAQHFSTCQSISEKTLVIDGDCRSAQHSFQSVSKSKHKIFPFFLSLKCFIEQQKCMHNKCVIDMTDHLGIMVI